MKERGDRFKGELKEKLEGAHKQVEEDDVGQISTTDVDSRFMKNNKGKIELSYNCQVTTDKRGFILQ
jgi:hypothetical protein